MIVTGFKNKKNVMEYLEAVEEYTDWAWAGGDRQKPTQFIDWEDFFLEYKIGWWFYIEYKDGFWYWNVNVSWKGKEQINYKEAILKLKWETMKEWEFVYVCNISEGSALRFKTKRILLKKCNDWYVCVSNTYEDEYREWNIFCTIAWRYAVPVPDVEVKEYTIKELEEKLWETIKIIK